MGCIRFIKNLNLKNEFGDQEAMVPFGAGDTIKATRIEVDDEDYCDIFLPDNSVLRGVASEAFENTRVPTEQVQKVAAVPENEEIEVEETVEAPALLDGTILSETNEEPQDAESKYTSQPLEGYFR